MALGVGIVLETIGLLGASWATKIWHLFLTQGIAFGLGMGFLFVASVTIIPQWFLRKRSFANSIGAAGSGIGGLVYSLAANAIIQSIGLGWAFRILAILAFAVNTICTILVKDVSSGLSISFYLAYAGSIVPLLAQLFQGLLWNFVYFPSPFRECIANFQIAQQTYWHRSSPI